ncbi:hypothetical protein JRO89_XS09G0180500 [Xanthoceras sorbifolium]|uniref:Phytocyanin domain-containing protein n=1 Tax=Xanthoceras sorbifolium TaxID=99658 RepID=A0ABQ8HLQ8_9ROSI|nr:hypothetical protein JRO89_XS09G0180500 [Xanthoceras sorbifolium]
MHGGGFIGVEAVKQFKVGDDFGWQEPRENNTSVYSQWAGKNRFQVGDSLSFEYKNDSVFLVDKWGYYHCNTSKAIIAFNNGKSVMNLDRPGPFYFISGTFDHCKNSQRLLVEVMGLHQISQSPSSSTIAAPPETFLGPGSLPSSSAAADDSLVVSSVTFYSVFVVHVLMLYGIYCY